MTRACDITGKTVLSGNNVSHSNKRTRRRFLPNLQNVHLWSEALQQSVALRISVRALKTIEHFGGLDSYLMKSHNRKLTDKALTLKKKISKKVSAQEAKVS